MVEVNVTFRPSLRDLLLFVLLPKVFDQLRHTRRGWNLFETNICVILRRIGRRGILQISVRTKHLKRFGKFYLAFSCTYFHTLGLSLIHQQSIELEKIASSGCFFTSLFIEFSAPLKMFHVCFMPSFFSKTTWFFAQWAINGPGNIDTVASFL